MHFEILAEERSTEAALVELMPRIAGAGHSYGIRVFQGKPDLLSKLRDRLRGYRGLAGPEYRVVVLVDLDRDDCHDLKGRLDRTAEEAGLRTRATDPSGFQVLNRIAIEELESWLIGDPEAVRAAFPRVSPTFERQASFRNSDCIPGGAAERFAMLLSRARYYDQKRVPKIETARQIAARMEPDRNRSASFQAFVAGLRAALG